MLFLMVSLVLSTGIGCRKKQPVAAPTPAPPAADRSANLAQPASTPADGVIRQRIHFALDRWELSTDATKTLAANATTLLANPGLRIRVEGHADERGGTEYNLALSEKRAAAIRRYLIDLGVQQDRIETIAYGEERPARDGHDEAAWSENRRGELAVTGSANH